LNKPLALNLFLTVNSEGLPFFFPLIRKGFMLETEVGTSIKEFLLTLPGIDSVYMTERIKTVFLNGWVVDDIKTAFLETGSNLALSAAMPGLVGATMRRESGLISFRSQITYVPHKKQGARQKGIISIRLFNLILKDLGVIFLKKGILLKPDDLEKFIKILPEKFWPEVEDASLNGHHQEINELLQVNWSESAELVKLKVC